nr:immunoglobulin light chain junction region [Macaca mulatta]MOV78225.1 immunoglobulin light chain junction region [Macaca mulatta]MOV78665.1 immunoglobulin light chain junction region [Macaca mulatta]MOV78942.1 immunoglobulin light chain junction region [Macaca mulatta]MOV80219.1 immunoglobulin light chain junction region [Macaca mulatta]
CMQALEFPPTF